MQSDSVCLFKIKDIVEVYHPYRISKGKYTPRFEYWNLSASSGENPKQQFNTLTNQQAAPGLKLKSRTHIQNFENSKPQVQNKLNEQSNTVAYCYDTQIGTMTASKV